MMSRILGGYPDIFTFRELHAFEHKIAPADFSRGMKYKGALELIAHVLATQKEGFFRSGKTDPYRPEAKKILEDIPAGPRNRYDPAKVFKAVLFYETLKSGKKIPCEQTPRNLFFLKEILTAYPEARVIAMMRDPRDVLLSQKNKWRRHSFGARKISRLERLRTWINYHPLTIARIWAAAERAMTKFSFDSRILRVPFEEFLSAPEQGLGKIGQFLKLPLEPSLLNIPRVASSFVRDDPGFKGIDFSRAGNWTKGGLTAEEILLCQIVTRKEMLRQGYAVFQAQASPLRVFMLIAIWPAQVFLALLFNLGRTKNILDSIWRRLKT